MQHVSVILSPDELLDEGPELPFRAGHFGGRSRQKGSFMPLNFPDQSTADHHTITLARQLPKLLVVGNTEPDHQGQASPLAQSSQQHLQTAVELLSNTRDAEG